MLSESSTVFRFSCGDTDDKIALLSLLEPSPAILEVVVFTSWPMFSFQSDLGEPCLLVSALELGNGVVVAFPFQLFLVD